MDVCLLGCGGMMPLPHRKLTALLLRHMGKMILVDCGEGTQVQIKLAGWGFKAIGAILFTHYHADHTAGLPGLLLTLANSGRREPVWLYGPPGLAAVVRGLMVIAPELPFDLMLAELPEDNIQAFSIGEVKVHFAPADHRIPCVAYSFFVGRAGRFDSKKAEELGVPARFWSRFQKGETIEYEGRSITPQMVLGPERKGIKIAYCTDSRPTDELALLCRNADLFVCEGIYGEDEKLPGAIEKKHMLFSEAANLAKENGARELWLTHYSPSIRDPEEYMEKTKAIFKNTHAGYDLMKTILHFENE